MPYKNSGVKGGLYVLNTVTFTWYYINSVVGDIDLLKRSGAGCIRSNDQSLVICGGNHYTKTDVIKLSLEDILIVKLNTSTMSATIQRITIPITEPPGWTKKMSSFAMSNFGANLVICGIVFFKTCI